MSARCRRTLWNQYELITPHNGVWSVKQVHSNRIRGGIGCGVLIILVLVTGGIGYFFVRDTVEQFEQMVREVSRTTQNDGITGKIELHATEVDKVTVSAKDAKEMYKNLLAEEKLDRVLTEFVVGQGVNFICAFYDSCNI